MEMEKREKDEAVAAEPKQRLREWLAQGKVPAAAPMLRKRHRKRRSALLGFLLHSENSLSKPKASIHVLDSPKSSGDVEVSDCEFAPSCPAFGAAGAQNGLPGPSIPRALRKRTFQKPVHSGYATDEFDDGQ